MKKLIAMIMVLALAALLVLPAGVAAAATPQVNVSGDFALWADNFGLEPVGSVYKGWEHQVAVYSGDIDGDQTGTCYFTFSMNSLVLASVGFQTFDGSVLGKTGTLTFRVLHQGFTEIATLGETVKVEQTIVSGTGELTNLRGTMHFTVTLVEGGRWVGEYSGQLHFTP